jgi:ABC-type dipeptide/oligopeptide/nickel transport system permease subunit
MRQRAMIAIGMSATPIFLRLTRSQVLKAKVADDIEAARAVGNLPWRIALRHGLTNITAPLPTGCATRWTHGSAEPAAAGRSAAMKTGGS